MKRIPKAVFESLVSSGVITPEDARRLEESGAVADGTRTAGSVRDQIINAGGDPELVAKMYKLREDLNNQIKASGLTIGIWVKHPNPD